MRVKLGARFIAILQSVLLGIPENWTQTQPSSISISPINPTRADETQQFALQSDSLLNSDQGCRIALVNFGAADSFGRCSVPVRRTLRGVRTVIYGSR